MSETKKLDPGTPEHAKEWLETHHVRAFPADFSAYALNCFDERAEALERVSAGDWPGGFRAGDMVTGRGAFGAMYAGEVLAPDAVEAESRDDRTDQRVPVAAPAHHGQTLWLLPDLLILVPAAPPLPDVSDAAFRAAVEAAKWNWSGADDHEPGDGWEVGVSCDAVMDQEFVQVYAPTLAGARRKALALIAEREALRGPPARAGARDRGRRVTGVRPVIAVDPGANSGIAVIGLDGDVLAAGPVDDPDPFDVVEHLDRALWAAECDGPLPLVVVEQPSAGLAAKGLIALVRRATLWEVRAVDAGLSMVYAQPGEWQSWAGILVWPVDPETGKKRNPTRKERLSRTVEAAARYWPSLDGRKLDCDTAAAILIGRWWWERERDNPPDRTTETQTRSTP